MHTNGGCRLLMTAARLPSRLRSPMSRDATTSARSISRAAPSLASAPGGTRKWKRSGIAVGLAMLTEIPRSRNRCHSPISLPTPSPSAFTCVVSTTCRALVSAATTSHAAWDSCRTSSRRQFTLQAAVLATVPEVDAESDQQPHDQANPGVRREGRHQSQTADDSRNRDERDPGRPERAVGIGTLLTENPHAGADQHEREQGADVDQLTEQLQRQEAGRERHGHAGEDRREVRRPVFGMDGAGPCTEQAVARHRVEHARLAEQHHEDDRAEPEHGTDVDRDPNPLRCADLLHRVGHRRCDVELLEWHHAEDRKSTRLNSSHMSISYAVFCLKKKKKNNIQNKKKNIQKRNQKRKNTADNT